MNRVLTAPFALLAAASWWSVREPSGSPAAPPPERTAPLRIGPPPDWAGHIGEGRFFNPGCPHCQLPEIVY